MSAATETRSFQAETQQLLDLMIHSLYSHKEIFLRELISNAADALDRLRLEALQRPELRGEDFRLRIRLSVDTQARTLTIDDNGIGMSREEVIENIGTIARSGTRRFAEELRRARAEQEQAAEHSADELIGQFGVGFYSAFMVAEEVALESRRADGETSVRWQSKGDGNYSVEDGQRDTRGTRVTLKLRPREDGDEEFQDFTDTALLSAVVKRHSDFVEYPIEMDVERVETDDEGHEERRVTTEVLNSMKPLWTRPRSEVEPAEYAEFYKAQSHDWEEPFETVHLQAEGTSSYTALLFVPGHRTPDLADPAAARCRVALYVKRVFVMAECEELLPPWLRFVRGLVDSADLPLNVSRETLQHARAIRPMRRHLVRKLLAALAERLKTDREAYERFWRELGPVLKEGIWFDDEHRDELARLCLFESSAGEGLTTLAEYVERLPDDQNEILLVAGPDRRALEASPHAEAARAQGREVLFLLDPVDEWVLARLPEFDGHPLRSLERATEPEGGDEQQKEQREARQKELEPVLEAVREVLDEHVKAVRLSGRLQESPAVLVADEGGLTPQMEAMLRASGQQVPHLKRVLELNPAHPVLEKLVALHGDADQQEAFAETVELLLGQALLAEGNPPPDPARFAKLLARRLG